MEGTADPVNNVDDAETVRGGYSRFVIMTKRSCAGGDRWMIVMSWPLSTGLL